MPGNFQRVFGNRKPVIGMVHLGALPGSPLHDGKAGIAGLVEAAWKDLTALQAAGFDAVMFGNENDRPYEFKVDAASTATMAYVIGALRGEIRVPFGVNVLWDPMSTMALAAATGASFAREIMTGTYASDMGPWTPDAGAAMRYRDRLGRSDLALLTIDDESFWGNLPPLQFCDTPQLQDKVRVFYIYIDETVADAVVWQVVVAGYPTGGDAISISSGVVSRAVTSAGLVKPASAWKAGKKATSPNTMPPSITGLRPTRSDSQPKNT